MRFNGWIAKRRAKCHPFSYRAAESIAQAYPAIFDQNGSRFELTHRRPRLRRLVRVESHLSAPTRLGNARLVSYRIDSRGKLTVAQNQNVDRGAYWLISNAN